MATFLASTPPSDYQDKKADVDVQYARMRHGGSSTMWIVGTIAVILVILFITATLIFIFFVGNTPPQHDITVHNNTNENITLLVAARTPAGLKGFDPVVLSPQQSRLYKATPGVELVVAGLTPEQSDISATTTAILTLSGIDYDGKLELTDGETIITDNLNRNQQPFDEYGISVQSGYNYPLTIQPDQPVNNNNPFDCGSPQWVHTIDGTGPNECPTILQDIIDNQYVGCQSACEVFGNEGETGMAYCCTTDNACGITGGCENAWPNYDFYTVFFAACPNCLITNCDVLNYSCQSVSVDNLNSYRITFPPR